MLFIPRAEHTGATELRVAGVTQRMRRQAAVRRIYQISTISLGRT